MLLFYMLFFATIVAVILTVIYVSESNSLGAVVGCIAALIGLFLLVFIEAPKQLGTGKVYDVVEEFTRKLDSGVAYQLVASAENGAEKIVLMKKTGTSDFYALRVKDVPPEHFTLVDGKPVAIAPVAPPVGTK